MADMDAISTQQAAKILGIPARTVRHQAKNGRLPVIYKGTGETASAYVFDRCEIERIAKDRRSSASHSEAVTA